MRLLASILLLYSLFLSSLVALFGASPTGSVTISGTAEVGQTLTASNNLADADGLARSLTNGTVMVNRSSTAEPSRTEWMEWTA